MDQNQKADILTHFQGQTITEADLTAYCTERSYPVMSLSSYQDEVAGYQTALKTNDLLPKIATLLSQLKVATTLETKEETDTISAANDDIRAQLMTLIEDANLEYAFFDLVLGQIDLVFSQTIREAITSIKNTSATVMAILAKDTLGNPLTISAIGTKYREYASASRAVVE